MRVVIGSGAAMVEYIHDGTAWKPTADDTGWVACTSVAGFDCSNFRVRRLNSVVATQGRIVPTGTGTISGAYVQIAQLPAGFAPASELMPWPVASTIGTVPQGVVTVAGAISMRAFFNTTAGWSASSSFAVPGGWSTL